MRRILPLVISILIVPFSDVSIVSAEEEGPVRFERWHHEFGAEIGYAVGHNIPYNVNRTNIQFAHLAANFQLDVTGNIGQSFYQGNLNWYPELNANLLQKPDFGILVGFSPLMFQ